MIYYVYQITNKINNKIYIGKRKYKGENPLLDSYMGSGKLIKEAIKKYGKNNFQKNIIQSFDNENDAFKLEKELVTKEFCNRKDTYNIHEGGTGSFSHINNKPIEKRENIIAVRKLLNSGVKFGGKKYFTEETYQKISNFNKERWKTWKENPDLIPDFYIKPRTKKFKQHLSEILKGENNPNFGKHWYIHKKAININEKKMFFDNDIPQNFITVKEWKDLHKDKKNKAYGKHWYNDGKQNYFLSPDDEKIKILSKGRIGTLFKKIESN